MRVCRTKLFLRQRDGNVAVMFALTSLAMIALAGLGIDVGRALSARATLNASADAAALAAATKAMAVLQSPSGLLPGGTNSAQTAGQTAATNMFNVDATRVGQWIGGTPTPSVSVVASANAITATVSYTASVPTMIGGMFATPSLRISGSASSQLTMPKYINISVLTDISQSMGLAATQAGITAMEQLTPLQCAFGCHVVSSEQSGSPYPYNVTPYETIAHNNGIQLRIDVIRQATQNMITTAKSMALSPPLISFGIYTLQAASPTHGLNGPAFNTLATPSTNYTSLYTAAGALDLGSNTSGGIGDTDDATAMSALTTLIPANGTGTQLAPLQYLFLMTDGVQDIWCSTGYGSHCTQAFDPTLCSRLKANGVTVGVIYTTYLQMPERIEFQALVANFDNQIGPNLQSCASPGWYYQASEASDIQNAINALFAKATAHGVLTQ